MVVLESTGGKKVCCFFSPRPDPGETTAIPSPPHIRVVSSRVRFVCLRRRPPLAGVFRCLCCVSVADDFAGIGWTARHSPGTDFDGVEPDQTHHHSTRQAAARTGSARVPASRAGF